MSTLRRTHDTTDAARAARRLAGVARRPAAGSWPDDEPDDPWDGARPDPDDRPGPDGFDWFSPAPVPPPDLLALPASGDPPRGVAGRLPGLRGAAGVPVTAAVAVVLVVAAVVAGVLLRAGAGQPEVVDVGPRRGTPVAEGPAGSLVVGAVGATSVRPTAGSTASPGASAPVVVDVVGRVRRPGLVRLPAGSRVADAVAAAGGATDQAALPRVNLARLLSDGEQVVVPDADDPLPAAPPVAVPGASGGATAPTGPLDLNAATAADLDGLPGVGPVIAGRIVAWRAEHQRFTRVDELAEVAGIGDRMLERLRPLVRV